MISRRTVLTATTAGLALSQSPKVLFASQDVAKSYRIGAAEGEHSFYEGAKPSKLWLYNGSAPGPAIFATKGEILEVIFVNHLDEPTTIHWHGIRNINAMDGVPGLTQDAVEPGDSFTYRFPLRDAGTFWYHAHNKAWGQVARGLYGPLIVKEEGSQSEKGDIVLLVDDWLLDEEEQIHTASLGSLHDWSHGGRHGNFLTVNGRSQPKIEIPAEGPVRLRFISAANARIMRFSLNDGLLMRVVAVDGAPCEPFDIDEVALAPAQRVDILLESGATLQSVWEISTGERVMAASFERRNALSSGLPPSLRAMPWYEKPDPAGARQVDIHMQGGAMGNLMSAEFGGTTRTLQDIARNEKKLWAFNGKIGSYALDIADVKLGDVVQLNVWNDTRWRHAMHLHGQHFWVSSQEFEGGARDLLRDTYLMQPGERAEFLFVADNPGDWLFHCHMLEHHAAGMGGVISIS